MPILAELSRRFHLLTTDAKPDPPRIQIDDNSNNHKSRRLSPNSAPSTPEVQNNNEPKRESINRQSSVPEGTSDTEKERRNSGEKKQTRHKTKYSKSGQTANIVNYNIVNSSGVKIGATTTYVCNVNKYTGTSPPKDAHNHGRTSPKNKSAHMSEEVEALSKDNKILTLEDMFVVKTHLGSGWKDVFKALGYSEGQLEQFEEHHQARGKDEIIYQTLLDWKQSNGSDAKIGLLVKALWRCQQYDCAERLAQAQKIPE